MESSMAEGTSLGSSVLLSSAGVFNALCRCLPFWSIVVFFLPDSAGEIGEHLPGTRTSKRGLFFGFTERGYRSVADGTAAQA
jgi:hypothetical protein